MRGALALVFLAVFLFGVSASVAAERPIQTSLGWFSDGATADTFWNSPVINMPGIEVTQIHCHGRQTLDLQVGATRPPHNPCYGDSHGHQWGWGVLWKLPGVVTVYQSTVDGGPYSYGVSR